MKTYQERVVIFEAVDADDAVSQAKKNAAEYADATLTVLPLFTVSKVWSPGDPRSGTEVYSGLRDSDLEPEAYLLRFFATNSESTIWF